MLKAGVHGSIVAQAGSLWLALVTEPIRSFLATQFMGVAKILRNAEKQTIGPNVSVYCKWNRFRFADDTSDQ
jgi:hypothetical protein